MIVQVIYAPGENPLYDHGFAGDMQMATFDDVNDFQNIQTNRIATATTYGEIVWGNTHDGSEPANKPLFPFGGLDGDRVHTFVDFNRVVSEGPELCANIRAAKWVDSKRNQHYLVLDSDTEAFLMSNDGKTIRRF